MNPEDAFAASDSVNLPCDVVADCARRRVLLLVSGDLILDMDADTAHRLGLRLRGKSIAIKETIIRSKTG